jgi:hypothetical protein
MNVAQKSVGILVFFMLMSHIQLVAQDVINAQAIYSEKILLNSPLVQMEATSAVNDMYNFKFERAANQFNWFKEKYPEHPLPYFLLGLNEWWKIMPNEDIKTYDDKFFEYMDLCIDKAKDLYDENDNDIEATFFLSAAYAFKSRLNADRKNWTKATFNGRSALKYLKRGREINELSPEFMLGDALYNYYSIWIPKNYPMLRPVMLMFKKGDQKLGIQQLEEVARNAFYTRTEAQYFLMRIYNSPEDENKPDLALPIAQYLHTTFPDNAYFHRYYASILYKLGKIAELETVAKSILTKIEDKMPGYEGISGRYGAFYTAYIQKAVYRNVDQAEFYYKKAIEFAESTQSLDSGYYLSSLCALGSIEHSRKNYKKAKEYYTLTKKHASKKSSQYKEANNYLKKNKKVK